MRYKRRKVQKGHGIFGTIARAGKKILKDVVVPLVMDKVSKHTT